MRFVAGEYDFFNGIEGSFKDEILNNNAQLKNKYRKKFKLLLKPFLNTEYLGFYLDSQPEKAENPLRNKHLRRAMSFAVNRTELVDFLRNGAGMAGTAGFVPPVLLNGVKGFGYDLKKAKAEIQLSGLQTNKKPIVLNLITTADYLDMAVMVKKYWSEIGITINIDMQNGGMIRQRRNKGDVEIFRGSWIADFADPENYLSCFYSKNFSPNGPNYTHYKNPQFDLFYEKTAGLMNGSRRNASAKAADSVMIEDAPIVVLYYDKSIRLMQNKIHGLSNDATNRLLLKRVKKF
jgi:peptide/nickel transport system substrate-binding protein